MTDEFTKEIVQGLDETRNSKKEVRRYMTLQSVIDEKVEIAKQEGLSKGRTEGTLKTQAKLVYAMFKDGLPIEQIARISNISIDKVKKILSSKVKN